MSTLSIELSADQIASLEKLAKEYQTTIQDLIRIGVDEMLAQPDERFIRLTEHIIDKNLELYRRLA